MWLPFNDNGKTEEEASLRAGKFRLIKLEVLISNLGKDFLKDQRNLELTCL